MPAPKTPAPENQWYEVRVECQVPATAIFRVYAKDPEDALNRAKNASPSGIKYKLAGRRNLKATVIEVGTAIAKLVKTLSGGWR
jgi:hypothetical protein